MQKLVNLNPANGAGRGGSPSAAKMNLAALVIPGVASLVCVIVGLLTLHEYCLDGGGFAAHAASPSPPPLPPRRPSRRPSINNPLAPRSASSRAL